MKNKNTKKIFKKRRSTLKTRGGDIEKDTAKIYSKCLNLQIELDEVIKEIYNDPNTSISTKMFYLLKKINLLNQAQAFFPAV